MVLSMLSFLLWVKIWKFSSRVTSNFRADELQAIRYTLPACFELWTLNSKPLRLQASKSQRLSFCRLAWLWRKTQCTQTWSSYISELGLLDRAQSPRLELNPRLSQSRLYAQWGWLRDQTMHANDWRIEFESNFRMQFSI